MIAIRPLAAVDWAAAWQIIEPVFRAGETYAFAPDITEAEAHKVWVEIPAATFIAEDEQNRILGTYYIKPNQPALGAHVCNCGYIVAEHARNRGIASEMCMQYNLVVATNQAAVSLWQKHGFEVIGTLRNAFRHQRLGFVDALVMYKQL